MFLVELDQLLFHIACHGGGFMFDELSVVSCLGKMVLQYAVKIDFLFKE